jgi:hypothetical protein
VRGLFGQIFDFKKEMAGILPSPAPDNQRRLMPGNIAQAIRLKLRGFEGLSFALR